MKYERVEDELPGNNLGVIAFAAPDGLDADSTVMYHASYVKKHELEVDEWHDGNIDYDPLTGKHFLSEGWYEVCIEWEEMWEIAPKITHWFKPEFLLPEDETETEL